MSILQIACLTMYAAGMSIGQLLFKTAAEKLAAVGPHTLTDQIGRLLNLALDPFFIFAIVLYMSLSVFWVWILSFTPLTRAYPFGALAFVFTLLIGIFFFRESVTRTNLLGLAFILGGIVIIARA
ncbi:MAG: EamA family transporter [Steroidobacteraceae bacterium]